MSAYVVENDRPVWMDADRLAALRSLEIMDTDREAAFDELTSLAARMCDAPIAVVSFVDEEREWFKSEIGLGLRQTSLDTSFCAHAILQPDLFVVPDATKDLRFSRNPLVTGKPHLRFYAGALLETDGLPLGTLCVFDFKPRPKGITPEQSGMLRALSQAVMSQLKLRKAYRALADSEERHRALIEASTAMVWRASPDGSILKGWGWEEFCGQKPEQYQDHGWLDAVHPEDRAGVISVWQNIVASGQAGAIEYRVRIRDGEYRWVLARAVPLKTTDGLVREWVGTITDIHGGKQDQEALQASEKRLRFALQAGRMIAWEQDLKTDYITRTENSMDLLGIGSGPLSEFLERVTPDDQSVRRKFLDRIDRDKVGSIEFHYQRPDGESLWLATRGEKAGPDRVVGVSYDITERKQVEQELWRLANHDPLTGLPNRSLFQSRLEEALNEAKEKGAAVSLLMIDLDDFKDVNDSFGHDAGDVLLKVTAARLSEVIRDHDIVARLGGDEFAILLNTSPRLDQVVGLAESIIRKLSQPISYADQTVVSRASIGVAAFPLHDDEPAELMKDADIALYRAKSEGRSCVVTYSPEMRKVAERRLTLRREVREAIARDQIIPFYQPKVCLATGSIMGFEALARWQHPRKGLLTPIIFGDAFDDPELATLLGKRLIGKVASDMRRWLKSGLNFGRVAINLSHMEFMQPSLADDIIRVLELAKVPMELFEVEITEKVFLDARASMVIPTLEKLRERGVAIALDDFGTGYASLTHLKRFPVDHIKIDRSFVRDIEEELDDAAIVIAVVGLGRSLKLQVTAEGVETSGQAQRLKEMGCDRAQGYLYSKPVAASDVPNLLSNWVAQTKSA